MEQQQKRDLVVMGVAGSGKTTLAQYLGQALGYHYLEGDDFHSPEGKALMASGQPLSSSLRERWVEALCQQLGQHRRAGQPVVLSYSGLIARHRQQIRHAGNRPLFIYLCGDRALLLRRLEQRQGHFMPPSQLDNQLSTMEPPTGEADVLTLALDCPPAEVLTQVLAQLGQGQ